MCACACARVCACVYVCHTGVLLTTYGMILHNADRLCSAPRRPTSEDSRDFQWDLIILDEGHKVGIELQVCRDTREGCIQCVSQSVPETYPSHSWLLGCLCVRMIYADKDRVSRSAKGTLSYACVCVCVCVCDR